MIHLVTDSCADIPGYLLQKYNITVVPLSIRVNGKEYVEGVDITPTEILPRDGNSLRVTKNFTADSGSIC